MSTSRTFAGGLTATQMNELPQGTLGYAQVVANQTGITTEVDLTGLSVTVTVVAGRRLEITGEVGWFSTIADDVGKLVIQQDGVQVQARPYPQRPASWGLTARATAILTPSAGSHVYKLRFARDTGTGSITMQAGATIPAFIVVKDIGT